MPPSLPSLSPVQVHALLNDRPRSAPSRHLQKAWSQRRAHWLTARPRSPRQRRGRVLSRAWAGRQSTRDFPAFHAAACLGCIGWYYYCIGQTGSVRGNDEGELRSYLPRYLPTEKKKKTLDESGLTYPTYLTPGLATHLQYILIPPILPTKHTQLHCTPHSILAQPGPSVSQRAGAGAYVRTADNVN